MDGGTRQLSVLIHPLPEDGHSPDSQVLLEVAGDFEGFSEELEKWKEQISRRWRSPYIRYESYPECRISGGDGEAFTVPNDEGDVITALISHCAFPGVTIREIRYRDAVYTDVSEPEALEQELQSVNGNEDLYELSALRCSAKRDGRAVTVYFLDEGLSRGIVETGAKRRYAGAYLYNVECTENAFDYLEKGYGREWEFDEDGRYHYDNYYADIIFHIFLETDGEDADFRYLLNGKLYPLISKTEDAVVFRVILDDYNGLAKGIAQDAAPSGSDLIFRNTGGVYRYDIENRGLAKSRYSGVVFTCPRLPEPDSLTDESVSALYAAFLAAKTAAFKKAETREMDGGIVLRHINGTEDQFSAQVEGFDLTLKDEARLFDPDYIGCYTGFESDSGYKITVLEAAFSVGEKEIALFPGGFSSLGITVRDPAIKEPCHTNLKDLRSRDSFPGEELPETAWFKKDFPSFLENLELYKAVRDALLRFGVHRLVMDPARLEQISRAEMQNLLYDSGMEPDQNVISLALELKNEFNRTGKIPNLALIGEAGTGKTCIVRKLGKAIFHREVREFSPSDLKAPYEGQTKYEVLNHLVQAGEENAIFFVDEAYELMADDFGREAVSLLLPLMTGRTKVDAYTGGGSGSHINLSVDFETGAVNGGERHIKSGVPPIWIAGYEDEIRMMLNQNKGLYRRLRRVTLAPPTKDQLYGKLLSELERQRGNIDFKKYDILKKQFRDQKDLLTRFFMWGAQPQNSPYFANYAGVESFLGRCLDGIDFDCAGGKGITEQMEEIITSVKRDVKRQLDTVRRKSGTGGARGVDDAERIQMISDIKTRFENLVGCETQIGYMKSIIDMLAEKSRYDHHHITVPKGALLLGPPGVGKTFIARAMAGELQRRFESGSETANKRVGFMSLSAPELVSKPVSFIGAVFDRAEEYDVCVIFIDEVDAIAANRFQNEHYSHFIELIKQMDGVEQRSNVFLLAATNAGESLDPAFTRSGRIDKKLVFDLPDYEARRELAERTLRDRCGALDGFGAEPDGEGKRKLSRAEDDGVRKLAEETAGLTAGRTPGDIENIINTAFILYDQELASPNRKDLEERELRFGGQAELGYLYRNLYEAVERFTIGDPRAVDKDSGTNTGENDGGRFAVSVHEVGHALVELLYGRKPFEKITSLPRGDALGYVQPSRSDLRTKEDFEIRIRSSMGGRIAEELVYGKEKVSTGASADMENATYWARMMVERLGFTEEFGFMALSQTTARHLGVSGYTCSEAFRQQSDRAVNELLKRLYQETRGLLAGKKELIKALAEEVVKRESMTGEEFIRFYRRRLSKKT